MHCVAGNVEFVSVKPGDTYFNHWALSG